MKQNLTWQVGFCDLAEARPSEYFEAAVPGAVQLDYAKKYNLPDFNQGTNYKQFKWMEDKFWVVRAMLLLPEQFTVFIKVRSLSTLI